MPGVGDIRAGRAFVEAYLRDNALTKGLKAAEERIKAFGSSVTDIGKKIGGIGAQITAPFEAMARELAGVGDTLDKMALRTGVSVEALSELSFAAEQSGADLGTVELGIKGLQKRIGAATKEATPLQRALGQIASVQSAKVFESIGININDIVNLSPEEQFYAIADALAAIDDPSIRAARAMELFEESGAKLLPLFANGSEGIEQLRAQARDLGLTMSREDATAAAALTDSMNILDKSFRAVRLTVGAVVAPLLTDWFLMIADGVKSVKRWADEHRPLIKILYNVGVAIGIVGGALTALGVTFGVLGAAAGVVSTALTALGVVLGVILSPFGLVTAAVVGLGYAFVQMAGGVGPILDWLDRSFGGLGTTFKDTFEGIKSALGSGDIEAALRILGAGLRLAWVQLTESLAKIWDDFIDGLAIKLNEFVRGAGKQLGIFTGFGPGIDLSKAIVGQGPPGAGPPAPDRPRESDALRRAREELADAIRAVRPEPAPETRGEGGPRTSLERLRMAVGAIPGANVIGGAVAGSVRDAAKGAVQGVTAIGTELEKVARDLIETPERRTGLEARGGFGFDIRAFGAAESLAEDQLTESKEQTSLLEQINDKAGRQRTFSP